MEHQDWNSIIITNKLNEKKTNTTSTRFTPPENIKIEAPKELSKMIIQARTTKKLKQTELANLIKVSSSILSRWESGKEVPTNLQIATLEKHLGIKLPRTKKIKQDMV